MVVVMLKSNSQELVHEAVMRIPVTICTRPPEQTEKKGRRENESLPRFLDPNFCSLCFQSSSLCFSSEREKEKKRTNEGRQTCTR